MASVRIEKLCKTFDEKTNDDISSASQSDQNIVNSNLYTTGLGSVSKR